MTVKKSATAVADATPSTPMAHLIPEQSFLDRYVPRKIEGKQDLGIFWYAMQTQSKVVLVGPTGPGKTSAVLAYCAWKKLPVVTIQCHGAVDPATFWGGLTLDPETGTYIWQDSEITKIVRNGGVLYIDEINFLPPKVASVLNGLLDARRQVTILEHNNELIHAAPDLQIIASYNPDYEGTKRLNEALKNRFNIKIQWDYDPVVESHLLACPSLQELASKLRASHRSGEIETPTSTNMLQEFETLATDISYAFAAQNFLAAYSDDERPAVKNALDLYSARIQSELKDLAAQMAAAAK